MTDFAEQHRINPEVIDRVRLCLTEAVTNAVLHAFRNRTASGTVVVSAEVDEHELVLHVVDDGDGLAPRPDSPGMGLGLSLIGLLSTSLAVRRRPGGGTDVRMSFALGVASEDRQRGD